VPILVPDLHPRFLAYCDGSSLANPGGPGATGFVVLDRALRAIRFGASRYAEDGPFAVTNNRMELRAVLEAVEGIPPGGSVRLTVDSLYVQNSLSKWIHAWRRRGWTTTAGGQVLNRDLIEATDSRLRDLRVSWQWVRGHDGHPVNEVVDRLAQAAARDVPGPDEAEVVEALRAAGVLDDAP